MKEVIFRLMAAGISDGDVPLPCADGSCDSSGLVGALLGWAYFAIGIVAVIIIIIAGIQYMTSEGEPDKTKRAQATITYTVIGLIIATLAAAVVAFVTGVFE